MFPRLQRGSTNTREDWGRAMMLQWWGLGWARKWKESTWIQQCLCKHNDFFLGWRTFFSNLWDTRFCDQQFQSVPSGWQLQGDPIRHPIHGICKWPVLAYSLQLWGLDSKEVGHRTCEWWMANDWHFASPYNKFCLVPFLIWLPLGMSFSIQHSEW